MIEGVVITPLEQMHDERGAVFHMLRSDSPNFQGFGEMYFSIINPGVVKGWKRHAKMVMNLAVPKGKLQLVLVDHRIDSSTAGVVQEIILGEKQDIFNLVTVPAIVWTGFKCLSSTPTILANCSSILHDSTEAEGLSLDDPQIFYQW